MTAKQRLQKYLESKGVKDNAFYSVTGLSNGYLNSGSGINTDKLEIIISHYPDLNLMWLVTGKGPMLNPQVPESYKQLEYRKDIVLEEPVIKPEIIVATQDIGGNKAVPMINYKAAANYLNGYQTQEYFEELDTILLPAPMVRTSGQYYGLQVVGDSMMPRLEDSAWVFSRLLDRSEWVLAQDDGVYVVVSGYRGIQIKRIKNRLVEYGKIICKSDNRAYPPYEVLEDDLLQLWKTELYMGNNLSDINDTVFDRLRYVESRLDEMEDFFKNESRRLK